MIIGTAHLEGCEFGLIISGANTEEVVSKLAQRLLLSNAEALHLLQFHSLRLAHKERTVEITVFDHTEPTPCMVQVVDKPELLSRYITDT